jgi:rhodanese-related sulfurtransferase
LRGGIRGWLASGYPLVSNDAASTTNSNAKIKSLTPAQFAVSLDRDYIDPQIVDLRGSADYNAEHIINSINIPLMELEKRSDELSLIKTVLIYANAKEDQESAAVTLFDLGYPNVYMLEGGLKAWKDANGKIESTKQ